MKVFNIKKENNKVTLLSFYPYGGFENWNYHLKQNNLRYTIEESYYLYNA